jgi:hypothetical protein
MLLPTNLVSVTSVYDRTLAAYPNSFAQRCSVETMWSSYDPPDRYEPRLRIQAAFGEVMWQGAKSD